MMFEIKLWINAIIKGVPGRTGCRLRNFLLPYKYGSNVTIWANTHIDFPSKLIVGNNVSINRNCVLNASGYIEIGNDVLIGPNVIIYSQNHNYKKKDIPIRLQGYSMKKVLIEDNVWIGANTIVLPGVTIGSNSIIGANSLVNKNVPKNTLVGGNPARVIKSL